MLIDIHSHLDMVENPDEIIKDAKRNKVNKIVSCSTSFESNKKNLLLGKNKEIDVALGIYPLDAIELNKQELDKAFYFFEENINKAKAIGEVGLDYKYCKNEKEKEKQEKVFKNFIDLAEKYNKPLIIHSRYAQRQVIELLEKKETKKVLLHSFVDSKKLIKRAVKNKWFISVGLVLLNSKEVQTNLKEIPLENLFFETDSPVKFNGKKIFPKDINLLIEKASEILEINKSEIEKTLEKNYFKLFS